MERETKLIVLISIFVVAYAMAIVLGAKIVGIFGLTFSASALTYALTYPMTDTIAEVWGKKKARKIIWIGLLTLFITIAIIYITILLPPASFWEGQKAFEQTLNLAGRILIASFFAFLISQHHDVWAFHAWKNFTGEKHLWLRNNASTFVSQFIDTIIFMLIAFYGVIPQEALIPAIIGQFVVKIGIAVIDTPFVYLLSAWARR